MFSNNYPTNYTLHPNTGIAYDAGRVYYLFATFYKKDPKHKGICQISVSKNPYNYIVRHNSVLFYYSTIQSLLRDWNVLTFEGDKIA